MSRPGRGEGIEIVGGGEGTEISTGGGGGVESS